LTPDHLEGRPFVRHHRNLLVDADDPAQRRSPILVCDLAVTGEIVLAAPMIAGAAGTNNPPEGV